MPKTEVVCILAVWFAVDVMILSGLLELQNEYETYNIIKPEEISMLKQFCPFDTCNRPKAD